MRPEAGVVAYTECRECGEETREGKPYCTDHVALMPYVQTLLQDLEKVVSHEPHLCPGCGERRTFLEVCGECRKKARRREQRKAKALTAPVCSHCDRGRPVVARGRCQRCYEALRKMGGVSRVRPVRWCPCGATAVARGLCDPCRFRASSGAPRCPIHGAVVRRRKGRGRPAGCPVCRPASKRHRPCGTGPASAAAPRRSLGASAFAATGGW